MTAILVLILAVSLISMVFNVAYILHELGWFPHGKPRGPVTFIVEPTHGGIRPSLEDCHRNPRMSVQSPYVHLLRRQAYPDLYAAQPSLARLENALQRFHEKQTLGRMEDLINSMNDLTQAEEPLPEARKVVEAAAREILNLDVGVLMAREASDV